MHACVGKFLKVVKIELEDLGEDILDLEESYEERRTKKEITEYVEKENVTLLKSESRGVARILSLVDNIDPGVYPSVEDCRADLALILKRKLEDSGFPPAVFVLVETKLARAAAYVQDLCD